MQGGEPASAVAIANQRIGLVMDGMMMGCGWGLMAIHLVTLVFLVLGIAAFAKYLFWSKG